MDRNARSLGQQRQSKIKSRATAHATATKAVEYFNVLTSPEMLETTERLMPEHRERLYPPTVALSMFMRQVLDADPRWRWRERPVRLVDGTGISMPGTEENLSRYPQPSTQAEGVGFPLARVVSVICLATGAVIDAAIGPHRGKGNSELSLLRRLDAAFNRNDVMLADSLCCSYFLIAAMSTARVDVLFEQNRARNTDFRRGQALGQRDHRVCWRKPVRPDWMTLAQYARFPGQLPVRKVKVGHQILVTTMLDPRKVSKDDLSDLCARRWNVALDLRNLKIPLPVQRPHPPIVVTALAPFSQGITEAAARGWEPISANFLFPKWVKTHGGKYVEGCARANRPADIVNWRVAKTVFVAEDVATAAAYATGSDGPYYYYYRSVFKKLQRRGALGVFKEYPKQPDDTVTLDKVIEKLVIHGSPARVADKNLALQEETGKFGTLLYAGVDWKDKALARNSMVLMAEKVLPLINR